MENVNNDIFQEIVTPVLGSVASGTTAQTTTGVNLARVNRTIFDIHWGAMSGAAALSVEISQDGSTYTAIKGDDGNALAIAVSTASANLMTQLAFNRLNGKKIRVVFDRTNTQTICGVVCRQQSDDYDPSDNTNVPVRYQQAFAPVRLPNGMRVQDQR